jgi:Zn-dependent M28 family amino/carboxypeptidase
MRKSNGFFLAIAALIMSVVIWGNPVTSLISAFSPKPISMPIVDAAAPNIAMVLSTDEALMMSHIAALAQVRYTSEQKASARQYIAEQLVSYSLSPVEQSYSPEEVEATTGGTNLIVDLPGSDPTAGTIVLGAHYDTTAISPGADDNGSAIATLLEAARLFSDPATPPSPLTLRLAFFDQEERQPDGTGLLGSLAFTQKSENISDVKGAVILDMVGYACHSEGCQTYPSNIPLQNLPRTGDFLAVLGLNDNSPLLGAFMSSQAAAPTVLTLPIPEATLKLFPDLLRSDHAPFWQQDIPAVFVTDTANFRNPHYHTAEDTVDTLDGPFLSGSAQHVVEAIATLLSSTY